MKINTWEEKFYKNEESYGKEIFRIPHKDISRFTKLLREISAKNILDLGCGTGRHVVALAKEGFHLYGIDASRKVLDFTNKILKQEGLKANLKLGDIYKKLPYNDGLFDGIISIKVLHHARVAKIKKLIKELERVMRPKGILMIEVPKKHKKRKRRKSKEIEPGTFLPSEGLEKGVPHHIFVDKEELKSLFKNFEVLDILITGRDKIQTPSPHYTMFARLK